MAEPVAGISAVPDEQNARYFHVEITGPKDVSIRRASFVCSSFLCDLYIFWPE